MHFRLSAIAALSCCAVLAPSVGASDQDPVARGEYLVKISGCNDCHTPGYPETDGQVPQAGWLIGNPIGFSGPWGTTYPVNLRLRMQELSETQWLARARQPMRPPMPWFNLRDMTDDDLIAIYRFVRSLGPAGEQMPVATGPEEPVKTAFIDFVARNPLE